MTTDMKLDDHDVEKVAEAFRRVIGEDGEGNRAVLIKRIPIICQDIMQIKTDMSWIKWLVMGMVGGMGALVIIYFTK